MADRQRPSKPPWSASGVDVVARRPPGPTRRMLRKTRTSVCRSSCSRSPRTRCDRRRRRPPGHQRDTTRQGRSARRSRWCPLRDRCTRSDVARLECRALRRSSECRAARQIDRRGAVVVRRNVAHGVESIGAAPGPRRDAPNTPALTPRTAARRARAIMRPRSRGFLESQWTTTRTRERLGQERGRAATAAGIERIELELRRDASPERHGQIVARRGSEAEPIDVACGRERARMPVHDGRRETRRDFVEARDAGVEPSSSAGPSAGSSSTRSPDSRAARTLKRWSPGSTAGRRPRS